MELAGGKLPPEVWREMTAALLQKPLPGGRRCLLVLDGADEAAAQQALQERVATLAMQPLDPDHPLWHFELIEQHDGGSALIARIHHCIADGIALISVMMSLVDGGALPPQRDKPARGRKKALREGAEDWVADSLIRPLGDITARALEALSK